MNEQVYTINDIVDLTEDQKARLEELDKKVEANDNLSEREDIELSALVYLRSAVDFKEKGLAEGEMKSVAKNYLKQAVRQYTAYMREKKKLAV